MHLVCSCGRAGCVCILYFLYVRIVMSSVSVIFRFVSGDVKLPGPIVEMFSALFPAAAFSTCSLFAFAEQLFLAPFSPLCALLSVNHYFFHGRCIGLDSLAHPSSLIFVFLNHVYSLCLRGHFAVFSLVSRGNL